MAQQHQQCWGITRLTGRQDQHQRQSTTIDQRVGLGPHTAAGTTKGVIVRFVLATARFLVIPPSPLCAP